jgi:FMN-binding domain
MRRITLWMVSTVAVLVLLFSYHTSTSGPDHGNAVAGNGGAGIVSSPQAGQAGGQGGTGTTPAPNSGGSGGSGGLVVNGSTARTRWGPVQVQVTIAGGKITEVTVLQQPNGNDRDQEINSYALPQLREQVLTAQSANIDGVSGATVTSDGYRQSLQAALDAAHFTG